MSNRTRTTSIIPRLVRKINCAEYASNPSLAAVPESHSPKPEPSDDIHENYTSRTQSNSTRHVGKEEQTASKDAGNSDLRHRDPTILERLQLALYLENSGSVARDHLALERTFLAYMRTSLLLASAGVGA